MSDIEIKFKRFLRFAEIVRDGILEMSKIEDSISKHDEQQFKLMLEKNPTWKLIGEQLEKVTDKF
jgi:hypothetical protein